MTSTNDLGAGPERDGHDAAAIGRDTALNDSAARPARVPKLGIWAWCFVGLVAAAVIVAIALGAVSEIALPLTFAAVLAIIFKPLVGILQRKGLKPSLAAGLVVL